MEDRSVINLDDIFEAADKVFATNGADHEVALMTLRSAVTMFRMQQAVWAKDMRKFLDSRKGVVL